MTHAAVGQPPGHVIGYSDHIRSSTDPFTLFSEDLRFVLDRTEPLWSAIRGERLFLTGGTGFFGRWLTETFDYANQSLGLRARRVTLTRRREPVGRAPAEYCLGDIRDFDFPSGRFAFTIHAAVDAGDLETSAAGTRRVAEFAARAGCRAWLFTSSGAAYSPQTPLGAAKLEAERTAGGAVIARCFAFVGPYLPLDGRFAAGNFLADRLAGRPIRVSGDGTAVRSYLYAAELAVHLWRLLFAGVPGCIYDVGARERLTVAELARMFGGPVEIAGTAEASSLHGRNVYAPDAGIPAEIPLAQALARTGRWYRVAGTLPGRAWTEAGVSKKGGRTPAGLTASGLSRPIVNVTSTGATSQGHAFETAVPESPHGGGGSAAKWDKAERERVTDLIRRRRRPR